MFLSAKEREVLPRFLLPANRRLKVIVRALNWKQSFESVRELRITFIMRIAENDIDKENLE